MVCDLQFHNLIQCLLRHCKVKFFKTFIFRKKEVYFSTLILLQILHTECTVRVRTWEKYGKQSKLSTFTLKAIRTRYHITRYISNDHSFITLANNAQLGNRWYNIIYNYEHLAPSRCCSIYICLISKLNCFTIARRSICVKNGLPLPDTVCITSVRKQIVLSSRYVSECH